MRERGGGRRERGGGRRGEGDGGRSITETPQPLERVKGLVFIEKKDKQDKQK